MQAKKVDVKMMVLAALFAGLTAVCAWLSIPVLTIAFTMQTFAIFLTLGVLGGKWGTISIAVYLLLGAVGLPVFSGFSGGAASLLGVTGGYIWGFLLSGLTYWALERTNKILGMALGMAVCYASGSLWFMLLYMQRGTPITLGAVLMICVVPYLIPDFVKVSLAYVLSGRIRKYARISA